MWETNIENKEAYLRGKYRILSQFGIRITKEIKEKIQSLYPSDISIENYTRTLIVKHLWGDDIRYW